MNTIFNGPVNNQYALECKDIKEYYVRQASEHSVIFLECNYFTNTSTSVPIETDMTPTNNGHEPHTITFSCEVMEGST